MSQYKDEGNAYYQEKKYDEALGKYHHALRLCQKGNLAKDEAIIQANCAQVCLQLELFNDAYDHAEECLRLDPDSTKVIQSLLLKYILTALPSILQL